MGTLLCGGSKDKPSVTPTSGIVSVVEGETVTLECTVNSDPPLTNVSWYKGSTKILHDDIKYGGSNTPSLAIKNAEIGHDEGSYRCEAANIYGTGQSEVHLNISIDKEKHIPEVKPLSPEFHSIEGGTVALQCTVESRHPVTRLSWYKGNVQIQDHNMKYIGTSTPSLLIMDTNKARDEGGYQCKAENEYGTGSSREVNLHVADTQSKNKPDTQEFVEEREEFSKLKVQVKEIHSKMINDLAGYLSPDLQDNTWSSLKTLLEPHVDRVSLFGKKVIDMQTLCDNLMKKGVISTGRYEVLYNAVKEIDVRPAELIQDASLKIQELQSQGMPDEVSANLTLTLDSSTNMTPDIKLHLRKHVVDSCQIDEDRLEFTEGLNGNSSIEIKGTSSRIEESSSYVAARFKNMVSTGNTKLTDTYSNPLPVSVSCNVLTGESTGFPHVSISLGQMSVLKGYDAVLRCEITASPEVIGVQWKRMIHGKNTDVQIDNNKYIGGSISTPTLSITNVAGEDAGIYICVAWNDNGKAESNKTCLLVSDTYVACSGYDGKPVPWKGKKPLTFRTGETIKVDDFGSSHDSHWWKISTADKGNLEKQDQLLSYEWFVGNVSQPQSERLLEDLADGTFFFRNGDRKFNEGSFAFSVIYDNNEGKDIQHQPLKQDDRGGVYLEENIIFKTILDLVVHYQYKKDKCLFVEPVKSAKHFGMLKKSNFHLVAISGDVQWFKELHNYISHRFPEIDFQTLFQIWREAGRSGSVPMCLYLLHNFPVLRTKDCLLEIASSGNRICHEAVEEALKKI